MGIVTRVCVLRSGGEYTPAHVQWLARQVPGLVCISDVDVTGVPIIPLRHSWPGWWSKMELFSDILDGDLLYLDLDTVVIGDLAELETVAKTTMLSDFYFPHRPASGLMYIAQSDKAKAWQEWMKNPTGHQRRCRTAEYHGDQGFLRGVIGDCQRWQDVLPGSVVSYKAHCKSGVPDGAAVVCFHGNPRPWSSGEYWVPALESCDD